jgi:SAM-dependent MidA family methyltransferase
MPENPGVSELREIIRMEIGAQKAVTFARFMELALYYPGRGYYETGRDRVGFQGDFYTSASAGELFGQLLAFRFAKWLEKLPATEPRWIVEAGAHDGTLARDILGWLRQHRPELYAGVLYGIVEPSRIRQEWQREKLAEFGVRGQWFEHLTSIAGGQLNGLVFSNELLDALPVHRLGWDAAHRQWFEWGVGVDGDKFNWVKLPAAEASLEEAVRWPEELLRVLPDGYTIETCPAAAQWWRGAAGVLRTGWLMTLDYGFTTEEKISPARTKGTVRAYFRHQLSDDLLVNPGEQDITAHVNFSIVQAVGEQAGLQTEGYVTQPQFLTGILAEAVEDPAFAEWNASRTRQFQTLTHPQHLGRAFKVLVQRKG